MINSLTKKIFKDKTITKINTKNEFLGSLMKVDINVFLFTRLIFAIIIFSCLLFTKYGYFLSPLITISFYLFLELITFDYRIIKRTKRLENDALFFFEVFALTLEGGRTLKHAIELTAENVDSELSEEFKRALAETKMGKSLNEVLSSMKYRIPSENINNAILNIIESNMYGTNVLNSIYNQIDYLRDKQMLSVKAEIAKLPTKVSVISVIFFVPIMLLIILAPVLINYIKG